MENFEKYLSSLPKAKLSPKADRKIKFKLYRMIFISKVESFFDYNWKPILMNKRLAVVFSVLTIFFATSIYAYASGNVLPGNRLYPLKLAIEKIEQKVAVSDSAKIATNEKISARRLEEAVSLSKKNQTANIVATNKTNENIKININAELSSHKAVVNSILKLSNDNDKGSKSTEEIINKAKINDQKEVEYLNKIEENARLNKNEEVLQKVNEAKTIITNEKYKRQENNSEVQNKQLNNENNNNYIKENSSKNDSQNADNRQGENKRDNSSNRESSDSRQSDNNRNSD